MRGRSFTRRVAGGEEILVSVQGLPRGTAVIRTFVPDARAPPGRVAAWLLLGMIGVGLLALSVAVSAQLARSLLMPLARGGQGVGAAGRRRPVGPRPV